MGFDDGVPKHTACFFMFWVYDDGGADEKTNCMCHQAFDDITFVNPIWLPGVDSETRLPDGSDRCYGKWTAQHRSHRERRNVCGSNSGYSNF